MKFFVHNFLILFIILILIQFSLLSGISKKKAFSKFSLKSINKRNKQTDPPCNKAPILTMEEKKFIVNYHNKLRNEVATKTISLKSNVNLNAYFPFASNMLQMYWDNQLANQAQTYANLCKTTHSSFQDRLEKKFKSNENIFIRKYKKASLRKPDFGVAIAFWFNKIKKFNAMKNNISSFNFRGVNIDSFAQIIWAKNYKIGCGFSFYQDPKDKFFYDLYVCLYGENSLIENEPIYQASATKECKCPNATLCKNSVYTNLCCPIEYCSNDKLFYEGPSI